MSKAPHPDSMFGFRRVLKGVRAVLFGPVSDRRRVFHEVVRVLARFFGGHYIGDDYKLWLQDSEFSDQFRKMSPHNYFSMERKFVLREFARHVSKLDGCVAECGSYVGVSSWFIAREIQGVDFFLFDSFEGLSAPGERDLSPDKVSQWQQGDLAVSEDIVKERLASFSNVHVMKGWIPERFDEVSGKKFKFLHVDVDLYEPTLASLEFFYERMVPGGVIIMDDYGFENCLGAFSAANEFMQDKFESIVHLPTGQGLIVKLDR
ncbi:TylF/MycF/NovP-related O-methyltransferase [Marinobacter sp. KM021]|uniref:TylF/MycF/NovP-related O-methyltransferase n=1 Tax=Marinobacter sp. KM021 TaxID=3075616 RepID=UPI003D6ADE50